MTNRLRLTWKKHQKGYEIVQFDPSLIDWIDPKNGFGKGSFGSLLAPMPTHRYVDEWASLNPEELVVGARQVISPIGNQSQKIDPIARSPDLYLTFANTTLSTDGILGFANENGLLGTGNAHETMNEWRNEIGRLHEAVSKWGYFQSEKSVKNSSAYTGGFPFPRTSLKHALEVGPTGQVTQYLEPENLLSAMWVQFGGAIERATSFSPCAECSNWIATVPGSNRPDKRYCSDACRMRAYRKRKAEKVK